MNPLPFPHAGEICALLAPMCWSVAVIGYRQTELPAASMNLFKNVVAVALLTITMLALGTRIPVDRSSLDWGLLAVSGLLGLVVADTLLFEGLRRIGAARLALVDTIYAPMMVLLSWAFLGERPGWWFLAGAALVVGGVTVATVDLRRALAGGDRELGLGVLMAFGAIAGSGVGVLLVKPILEQSDLVEVTWTRLLVGIVGQVLYTAIRREWGLVGQAFRPSPAWRPLVPAAIIGTYFALMLWLGGFKWANASVAAVLNQMATVYTLVLAAVVLREGLEARQVVGGLVAVAGTVVIVLT